ncbi:hypothetical protein D9M72_529800 [compost metagenome]
MRRGPVLEQVELPLARAAGQVVAARLQQQLARRGERHGRVGAIEFFLDDHVLAVQCRQRRLAVVGIAGLQARAFQMRSTRVLEQRNRRKRKGRERDHVGLQMQIRKNRQRAGAKLEERSTRRPERAVSGQWGNAAWRPT